MNILVVQISTNDMRGIVFNENSDVRYQTEIQYHPWHFGEGIIEQNPLEWNSALIEICRNSMDFLNGNGESLDAIVYTSLRSSIIPVNEKGKALRNAVMWTDKRNADYVRALSDRAAELYERSGSVPNTVFSGTKMRWIMDHEPEIYKQTFKFCTIGDYLNHLMTGEFKTDFTYAGRSLLMNIGRLDWDDTLLRMIGVEKEKLCEIVAPGSITGFTTEAFSKSSGVPAGIPVISAGGDQQCNALGAGVLQEHSVEITVGPGGYILASSLTKPTQINDGIMCSPHAIPGKYLLECAMINSDDIFRWINRILYGNDKEMPKSFVRIDQVVDETPAGSHGCIMIPYLHGRGTPDWNMNAFGGFLNVTPSTTKGDMARSTLEAIACEMKNMLDVLKKWESLPGEIFLGGYLVHSRAFCQMLADVTGIVMKRNITPIAQTAFGAFVSASVTLGFYCSHEEAYLRGKQHSRYKTFVPDPENYEIYDRMRGRISRLYECLIQEMKG